MNYWVHIRQNTKKGFVYVILNKKYNAYKFGVTIKDIEERLEHYCSLHCIDRKDIEIKYLKVHDNPYQVEKSLMPLIKGKRLKIENQTYREHFIGDDIFEIINNQLNERI